MGRESEWESKELECGEGEIWNLGYGGVVGIGDVKV